jgi:hypothetical protein
MLVMTVMLHVIYVCASVRAVYVHLRCDVRIPAVIL